MERAYKELFGVLPEQGFVEKGFKTIPKFKKLASKLGNVKYMQIVDVMKGVPEKWQLPRQVIESKFTGCRLDNQYLLHKTKNDKLYNTEMVGRIWSPKFNGKITWNNGLSWGSKRLKLEPQFSGMSEEVVDRYTVSAIQSAASLFSGTRQEQLLVGSRSAIKTLTEIDFNAVRYLWRLCVLYLSVSMVEMQGYAFNVTSAHDLKEVKYLDSMADLNHLLVNTTACNTQVVYIEAPKYQVDMDILQVLNLALAQKIQIIQPSELEYPALLNYWPDLNNAELVVYGLKPSEMDIKVITSGQVMLAIDAYVQQYGLQSVYQEVLANVAVFAMRPEGDSVFNGHAQIELALPKSQMEAGAMGPLLATVRHWERDAQPVDFKDVKTLLWEGAARYMVWAVCHKTVLSRIGGELALHVNVDDHSMNAMRLIHDSQMQTNGVQLLAQEMMEQIGWDTALGRILVSTIGMTKATLNGGCQARYATALMSNHTVQWEEVMPYVDAMPADAAISAYMYPPRPKMTIPLRTWVTSREVENSATKAEAMYALMQISGAQAAVARTMAGDGSTRYKKIATRYSYRGQPLDHQYSVALAQEMEGYQFVARLTDGASALQAILVGQSAEQYSWIVEDSLFFRKQDMLPGNEEKSARAEAPDQELQQHLYYADSPEKTLAEQQRLRDETLQFTPEQLAKEEVPEDPFLEQRLQRRREATGVRKKIEPDMLAIKAEQVASRLGFEPEWVEPLRQLRKLEKLNPIEWANQCPGKAQSFLANLKALDVRQYPEFAEDRTDMHITLKNMASIIRMGVKYVPQGESQLDVSRIAMGLDVMAVAVKVANNYTSLAAYEAIEGKVMPTFIDDDLFEQGIQAGISVAEMRNTNSYESLRKQIDISTQYIEENARKMLQESIPQDVALPRYTPARQGKGEEADIDAENGSQDEYAEMPPLEPVSKTREDTRPELQQIESTETASSFGPTPIQQQSGAGEQQRESSAAQSAASASQAPTQVTFSSTKMTEAD